LPRVRISPPKLGGAAGYSQFVSAGGKISLPPNETIRLPAGGAVAVASGTKAAFYKDATVDGTHLRIYTARLDKQTAIVIARPLTEVDHALSRIRLLFLLVSLVAVAGAAAVGLLVSRATLRPVKRLTDDAERIAATGDLSERTDEDRSDELGRLAVAFNTMLDALAKWSAPNASWSRTPRTSCARPSPRPAPISSSSSFTMASRPKSAGESSRKRWSSCAR